MISIYFKLNNKMKFIIFVNYMPVINAIHCIQLNNAQFLSIARKKSFIITYKANDKSINIHKFITLHNHS